MRSTDVKTAMCTPMRRPAVLRHWATSVMWLRSIALALLVLTCSFYGIELTPQGAVEFTAHMAEEGEHCYDHCAPLFSLIAPPVQNKFAEEWQERSLPGVPDIVLSCEWYQIRDRPPPLCASPSHSLRAPPTLISA
ncbi:MAG: hypothetical protein WA045_06825 [Nitrospira sp.]